MCRFLTGPGSYTRLASCTGSTVSSPAAHGLQEAPKRIMSLPLAGLTVHLCTCDAVYNSAKGADGQTSLYSQAEETTPVLLPPHPSSQVSAAASLAEAPTSSLGPPSPPFSTPYGPHGGPMGDGWWACPLLRRARWGHMLHQGRRPGRPSVPLWVLHLREASITADFKREPTTGSGCAFTLFPLPLPCSGKHGCRTCTISAAFSVPLSSALS